MAIIYTYPVKATPVDNDLILISDSADSNKTKQVTVASIKGLTSGVTSIIAGTNVTISSTGASGTGDVTINASGGGGSVDSVSTTDGTYINLTPNSATTGPVTVTADLSAIDGTSAFNTRFLSKDNTWDVISPAGLNTQIQYNNNGFFGSSANFKYDDSAKVLTIGDQDVNRGIVSIAGGSSGAGELRLGDPGTSGGTVTLKGGNDHAVSYTIKLPDDSPLANNKILESDASGNLTWINTPTGGGISFSGSTANGIATYSNSTTAAVSSVFTVSGNKLSAPSGTLADPSIEVGAVGGLYAASGGILLAHSGTNAIGVSSSSIVNYKLTQLNSGLKFGSAGSTLSNYEFGTWTPTVYAPAGSWSGTASTGYYEVIGNMVRAYFKISTTSYPANYPMNINNLPIAASTTAAYLGGVQVYTNTSSVEVGRATTGIITGANIVQFKTLQTSGNVNELIDSKYQPTGATGTLEGLITYKKA